MQPPVPTTTRSALASTGDSVARMKETCCRHVPLASAAQTHALLSVHKLLLTAGKLRRQLSRPPLKPCLSRCSWWRLFSPPHLGYAPCFAAACRPFAFPAVCLRRARAILTLEPPSASSSSDLRP